VTVDLITQGLTIVLVIYFGLHLRSQLRTLKHTVEAQKATIEAQAESMKAQSTVLQDLERHSKIMQQVIDFFDPTAQLQREQAYKERFERAMKAWEEAISNAYGVMTRAIGQLETDLARRREDTLWLKESNRELEEMSRQVHEDNHVLQEILEDRNHAKTRSSPMAGSIDDQP
jgi:chromosome segregation ATPase